MSEASMATLEKFDLNIRAARDAFIKLDHACLSLSRQLMEAKDENAKLRELVSVVYGYYASGTISPCDICDSIGCQYVGEAESGCRYHDHFDSAEAADDEIQRQMRELGIEVDDGR